MTRDFVQTLGGLLLLGSIAGASCAAGGGPAAPTGRRMMEHLIASDPGIAAWDAALNRLYRAWSVSGGAALLSAQRRWLRDVASCRTSICLRERYDARNGALLQLDGGRRVARRFHLESGSQNGDLLVLVLGSWLTYDATQTVVGERGASAGDVGAARMQGTTRLIGNVARVHRVNGCAASLTRNRDLSWTMRTRGCFDADRGDLNAVFQPIR